MKQVVLIFAIICAVGFAHGKIETEDSVLVLTKDNIDEAIKENDFLLIEFYAPWCGHCKALAPEYAKAAKKLEEIESPVKLAKVDATVETELAEKHMVRGYPTLKFFRKGSALAYSGGRLAEEIVSWVTKKSGSPAKELTNVEEAKAFIEAHNIAVIGFFKDLESDGAKEFLEVATVVDDYEFGITSSNEVMEEYGAEDGKVILFKKFEEGKNEYTGELEASKIRAFISVYALPLVVEFNQDTAQKIFSGHIRSHLLVFLSKQRGDFDEYVEKIKEPAKKFRGEVVFVTINLDEADHSRILEFFGMKNDDAPGMRIINLERGMIKYNPEKPEISSENVEEFVAAFLEGKLKRYLLTQELPEDWDKNPVKILVSTNFYEVAFDKKKNVLVEFYAPWCGHCQNLAPIYEQLGEKYKDSEDIVIAKMDATENELETIKVINYPTITLFKKETNEAVQYDGERTLAGLSKFIESDGAYGRAVEETYEEDEDDDVPRKDEL